MATEIDNKGPFYLTRNIVEAKRVPPRYAYGMTREGYTTKSGAPTSMMIRLDGEKIWRRVMCWCFSNSETLFIRVKGQNLIVNQHNIPEPSEDKGQEVINRVKQAE